MLPWIKARLWLFVALVGCALMAFVTYWYLILRYHETTDNAYIQSHSAVISPKVTGYIKEIAADDNQRVTQGFRMIKIDDVDYQASLKAAEASLLAREAGVQSLRDKIDLQQSLIAKAKATVEKAQAEVERSRKDLERAEALLKQDFVTLQKHDTLKAAALAAEASLHEAEAAFITEQKQIQYLKSSLLEHEALKQQAKADLDLAKNNLLNTVIIAPFEGIVGNKSAQIGQLVRPGMHLMTLVPIHASYVIANFKETQITRMKPGQPVSLKIDAYPGETLDGEVDSISPATGAQFSLLPPDNATGNFTKIIQRVPVKIKFKDHSKNHALLRPGLSVIATVFTR